LIRDARVGGFNPSNSAAPPRARHLAPRSTQRRADVVRLHPAYLGVGQHLAVGDGDLDAVREAGFDDGTIAEVVANVAFHVFTNYFNQVADTDLDFPSPPELRAEPATAS
jgi:hypothetical protein